MESLLARVRAFRLSPLAFRRIALVAAILIAIIIVTGAAVRLTNSGLGCPDWPKCDPHSLTARPKSDFHKKIESTNRMFTGLVSIAVMVAVLGALRRAPRRRDLTWLSIGLVAGVVGQIVLGGITVLMKLAPPLVAAHLVLSLLLLWDALLLHHRAGEHYDEPRALVDRPTLTVARLLVAWAGVVVVTGTVVTGTGPHAGDLEAKRYDLYLPDVAKVHGTAVWIFLAGVLGLIWMLRTRGAPKAVQQAAGTLLVLLIAQGALGYIQYFNGVPALLVGFHVAGATAVFAATVVLNLRMVTRGPGLEPMTPPVPAPRLVTA
jgi:cytochrome c oxidase assembly protein subunit 15